VKHHIQTFVFERKKEVIEECCEMYTDVRNHTNEKQRCVEQKVVVILGLSVFKQQHTQELKQ